MYIFHSGAILKQFLLIDYEIQRDIIKLFSVLVEM